MAHAVKVVLAWGLLEASLLLSPAAVGLVPRERLGKRGGEDSGREHPER